MRALGVFNSEVLVQRSRYFRTLLSPPSLSSAVDRIVRGATLRFLSLAKPPVKGLGSAGKRSKEQQAAAKAFGIQAISSTPADSLLAFTDGSAQGNPGPCGAGAHLVDKVFHGWSGSEAIGALGHGSNSIGELWAVGMALELAAERLECLPGAYTHLFIFIDSAYTVGCLDKSWRSKTNQCLVSAVRARIRVLRTFVEVHLVWVPAHVGIQENEHADFLAEKGSSLSEKGRANVSLPLDPASGFLPRRLSG